MYKYEYQGGPFVDVLSCQGRDPLNKWKIMSSGGIAQRVYDKDVKGFICHLEGSTATSKIQLPKDGNKQSLGLTQKYLVFQVFIPSGKDFSVELSMTDVTNSKRRLLMSTSIREMSITPLHAKVNLSVVKRNTWLNLCFDLASLLSEVFLKQLFKCLDVIIVAGNCKVRKIFTMRNQPPDTTECESWNGSDGSSPGFFQLENVPPSLQFGSTIMYSTQVINVKKVRNQMKPHLNDERQLPKSSARDPSPHIAFGTRVRLNSDDSTISVDKVSSKISKDSSHRSKKMGISKSSIDTDNILTKSNYMQTSRDKKQVKRLPFHQDVRSSTLSDTTAQNNMSSPDNNIPASLAKLVDELEMASDEDFPPEQDSRDGVFSFSSTPHSAQSAEVSQSRSLSPDFVKSPSFVSERPGSMVGHSLVHPQASRSPKHSPRLQEAVQIPSYVQKSYNSTRYTSKSDKHEMVRSSHSVGKSIASEAKSVTSLRDSDATLISSVDTLVHNSTSKENNAQYPEDSLEGEPLNTDHEIGHHAIQQSVTLSRKNLREIPPNSTTLPAETEELASMRVDSWSESYDARMLSMMKREQEEESLQMEGQKLTENLKGRLTEGRTMLEENEEGSFDASWSTWKQPPGMDSEAYAREMKGTINEMDHLDTLELSLNHPSHQGMENLPSPPIVLPSERARLDKDVGNLSEVFGMSDGSTVSGHSTSLHESDDEEMLDLMYDPCLNCYFDPKTGRYYELKG